MFCFLKMANKIGTYGLAIAARHHGVGFMVVAPTSTIDSGYLDGRNIPIEIRTEKELLSLGDKQIAPPEALAWNPVFDVTPASLIDALVTEQGVLLSIVDEVARLSEPRVHSTTHLS